MMTTNMISKLEYAVEEFFFDNEIEYSRDDKSMTYSIDAKVHTADNKVTVVYYPTGYSVKMYPVGPDAVVVKKNVKELTYFCSLLNGIMENGFKFYIKEGTIVLEKFVDCIERKDCIPASTKINFNFFDVKEKYEKYLGLVLLVNHNILSTEKVYEEAQRISREGTDE